MRALEASPAVAAPAVSAPARSSLAETLAAPSAPAARAAPAAAVASESRDEPETEADPEPSLRVLGPAPHAFAKLRGRFRWHILLKSPDVRTLRRAAAQALDHFEAGAGRRGVKLAVDVDPIEVL